MRGVAVLPEFYQYYQRIKTLPVEPLLVILRTATAVSASDHLALDGLLALGAAKLEFGLRPFPPAEQPFWLPLPLQQLEEFDGLPLWASTDFTPIDAAVSVACYHRRGDSLYALRGLQGSLGDKRPRRFPSQSKGQYMDYRIPEQLWIARQWIASCVGNKQEIERLLAVVTNVGAGAARGNGRVLEWIVQPLNREFSLRDQAGMPLRPIPVRGRGVFGGWTPPYWQRLAWRTHEPATGVPPELSK